MHAVCVLHVVLNPASRVSAVDRSKQQVCNARKASDHAVPVILCHLGLPGHGAMKAQAVHLRVYRTNKMSFDFPDHSDIDPQDPAASFKSSS